jgi:D-amino peptidase
MGKKYIVRCDIEGVTGVVSYEQAEPGKSEFEFGSRMFMSDLCALIAGLNEGGAESIVVYDEHFYGRNVDLSALADNVSVVCGKPPYTEKWAGGLDESFTGIILLGYHSKRGTGELLNHTYEPDIQDILLNGISVGEIGIEAAIAGDYGVPLQLITGDSAGIAEARHLVPGCVGVTVKESLSETGGLCYPAAVTSKLIKESAKNIVINSPSAKPLIFRDVHLQIKLKEGKFRSCFEKTYPEYICDGIVSIKSNTVTQAWANYWAMKLAVIAAQ